MKKKIFLVLAAIVLLGGWLRFWQLADYPVSLTIDEIAIGYNAYSILKTARDEHGQFLPLAFRSIGDYKPPALIYLMVPVIGLFGLNEWSVRLTIALIGTLTIVFVYLLTRELTKNKTVALLTAFSLAISPWHIQFSRATFEAILALFFLIVGGWLFLRAMRQKGRFLWLAAVFLVLSMYSYHAERAVVPVLVFSLAVIFRRELWRWRKETSRAILIGLLLAAPLFNLMLGPEGRTRAQNAFLGRDYEIASELQSAKAFSGPLAAVFNSQPLILFNFWLKRYLDYWDLNFLFFDGLQLTQPGLPGIGLFHSFELILFLLGFWLVFFRSGWLGRKEKRVLTAWLLIGPLAASVANNAQHPLRSLTAIPAPQILVAFGGFWLLNYFRQQKRTRQMVALVLVSLVVVFSLIYYLDLYYVHYPIQFSEFWDYGMKEIAQYVWQHQDQYREVVIDPRFGTTGPTTVRAPYLYLLFYGRYDPWLFQNSPRRRVKTEDSVDFENFTFRSIYWPTDRYRKNTLFVGSPWSLPQEDLVPQQIKKEIRFKNGVLGFLIVATGN